MSKVITQTVVFKTSPHELYEALMDSEKHAAFTNSEALISREVGGDYSAYAGYINGKNLELVLDQKIAQTWRAADWPENFYSKVVFQITQDPDGTRLDFSHSGVPDGTEDEFAQGWIENYWDPLHEYLEK
jgi:activator of HSP90 ATPase